MGSYQPWKKDSQGMRESGKLLYWKVVRVLRGYQSIGHSREMENSEKDPLTESQSQHERSRGTKVI